MIQNFHIANFPSRSSNIPYSLIYSIWVFYSDGNPTFQYFEERLKSSLRKLYGRYAEEVILVDTLITPQTISIYTTL